MTGYQLIIIELKVTKQFNDLAKVATMYLVNFKTPCIFKSGARWLQASACQVSQNCFCADVCMCVCVCVCVRPRGY